MTKTFMAKARLKTVRTDVFAVIDADGEILEQTRQERRVKVKGDTNYTQWLHNLSPVIKLLRHVSDLKLLYWIGQNLQYNEGMIGLNKVYKVRCAKEMKISISAIDKSLRELKEIHVLMAHEDSRKSAIYRVNPAYLWRGDSKARDKNEREWLERERIDTLPHKKIKKQTQSSTKKRGRFDFRGVKPDPTVGRYDDM